MRFFTSDWHLGSTMMNKYAHRPFQSQIDACVGLIQNCNTIAKSVDIVFHVGDFWLSGSDRHSTVEDRNELPAGPDAYIRQLSARFVMLAGNHDDGHNCEADYKSMVLDLNQNYRNVYVNHFPSDHKDYHGPHNAWKHNAYDINLCGHVHDKWLLKWDIDKHVLNINVGVDVWNYKPVRDAELTDMLDFVMTGKKIEKIGFDFSMGSFTMTRQEYDAFVNTVKHSVQLEREERRAEKLAKKGLTPEICQQRKEAALRKKGLLK